LKIKKILVSQPKPKSEKSPYHCLADRYDLNIDFRKFIEVEGVTVKEFRKQKVEVLDHSAIIFTSRTAIDHFFRICNEMRVSVPESMKYFCISESVAYYLQKYIVYRKRKIFYGNKQFIELIEVMKKYKDEKFLIPLSEPHKKDIIKALDKSGYEYNKAVLYRTISSDLSDLSKFDYDMLVFFSPSGIKSLFENFPNFTQNGIKIASFGTSTAKAAKQAGLNLDVKAPTPEAPSMTMAIEQYINKKNGKN